MTRTTLALCSGVYLLCLAAPIAQERRAPTGTRSIDLYVEGSRISLLTAESDAKGAILHYRHSSDGGASWSAPVAIEPSRNAVANPGRNNDPQVATFGDRVTAVWPSTAVSTEGKGQVESAFSLDGGRSWQRGARVNSRGIAEGWGFMDVAADAKGRVTAVWIGLFGEERGLRFASSEDGGKSWLPTGSVDPKICECCWNILSNGWNDTQLALYRDIPRDMAIARTSDRGKTWQRLATVGEFGWTIEGCPDVGGALVKGSTTGELYAMVWTGHEKKHGLYVLRSTDNGQSWGEPSRVGHELAKHADLAFDGQSLVVAWDASVKGDVQVGWSSSRDGGRTWRDGGRLSTPGRRATHPKVAATSYGTVAAWTETDVEQGTMTLKTQKLTRSGSTAGR